MEPTSSPTSSEPSPWSRSNVALAAWLAIALFFVVSAFAIQAADSDTEGDSEILFEYELRRGQRHRLRDHRRAHLADRAGLPGSGARRSACAPSRPGGSGSRSASRSSRSSSAALLEPYLHAGEEQGLAPDRWVDGRAGAFALNAVVIVLVVPFAEELFFRGLGVRVLAFLGEWAAIARHGRRLRLRPRDPRRDPGARPLRGRARLGALPERERLAGLRLPRGLQPRRHPRGPLHGARRRPPAAIAALF